MNPLILVSLLIFINSIFLTGCSLVAPFKPTTTCIDAEGRGVKCSTVESNLIYSMEKDNPAAVYTEPQSPVIEKKSGKKKSKSKKPEPEIVKPVIPHSDLLVEKDELVRLMSEMNIDSSATKRPVMIPPASYRVLILPYADGNKYYSGRYLYITAGKPKWVSGAYVVSGKDYYKISPKNNKSEEIKNDNSDENVITIESAPAFIYEEKEAENAVNITPKEKQYKVRTSFLNCRDMPSLDGIILGVFEQDAVPEILDKSDPLWWKVKFHNDECYINSKYLYSENN